MESENEDGFEINNMELGTVLIASIDGEDPFDQIRAALSDVDSDIENLDQVAGRFLCRIEDVLTKDLKKKYASDESAERKGMVTGIREVQPQQIASGGHGETAVRQIQREVPWSEMLLDLRFEEIVIE